MKRLLLGGILLVALSVAPVENAEALKPDYCKKALRECVRDCSGSNACITGCAAGYFFCDGWGWDF
ncbi:MAG: hypothetical protein ACP5ON_04595 [Bacteroidota bacterium]